MAKGRGVVLEVRDLQAVVLDETGLFRHVSAEGHDWQVGDEIWIDIGALALAPSGGGSRAGSRGTAGRPWWRARGWAVAAACALLVVIGVPLAYQADVNAQTVAIVTLDVNPSVQLDLNASARVLRAAGLDAQGQTLLSHLHVNGLPLATAVTELTDAAATEGFVSKTGTVPIVIAAAPARTATLPAAVATQLQAGEKSSAASMAKEGYHVQVAAVSAPRSDQQSARALHLSLGRYLVYQQARSAGLSVKPSDFRGVAIVDALQRAGASSTVVRQVLQNLARIDLTGGATAKGGAAANSQQSRGQGQGHGKTAGAIQGGSAQGQGRTGEQGRGGGQVQNAGQSQGAGQGRGAAQGQGRSQNQGDNQGQGAGQDQGNGRVRQPSQDQGSSQGSAQSQGSDQSQGNGQGQAAGQGRRNAQGQGSDQGQGNGQDQGAGQGSSQGTRRGQGSDQSQGGGRGTGSSPAQTRGAGSGNAQGQHGATQDRGGAGTRGRPQGLSFTTPSASAAGRGSDRGGNGASSGARGRQGARSGSQAPMGWPERLWQELQGFLRGGARGPQGSRSTGAAPDTSVATRSASATDRQRGLGTAQDGSGPQGACANGAATSTATSRATQGGSGSGGRYGRGDQSASSGSGGSGGGGQGCVQGQQQGRSPGQSQDQKQGQSGSRSGGH